MLSTFLMHCGSSHVHPPSYVTVRVAPAQGATSQEHMAVGMQDNSKVKVSSAFVENNVYFKDLLDKTFVEKGTVRR